MKHSVVARALLSVVAATLASCATPSRPSASLPSALAPSSDAIVESYGSLLDKYVTPEGVRYHDWVQSEIDLAQLKEVTDYYANNQPPAAETEALAWHLNAYNAWILQRIFDNWPNKGPLDVNLFFFHKKSITVSGERISLLHLENQIIRHRYDDPRIHFALNCASQSCPPLHDEPFRARDLDGTLQRLTVEFLNENPEAFIETDREIQLSKIFEWYQGDFGGPENFVNFINRYRDEKLSLEKKVTFLEYNWQLNASR